MTELPPVSQHYPSLPSILRKYDRYARGMRFTGEDRETLLSWQRAAREKLSGLLPIHSVVL